MRRTFVLLSGTKDTSIKDLIGWHRRTVNVEGKEPHISNTAFVAPSATLCGRVEVWDFASVWSDAVVRGDVRLVRIGAYTNIQDGTTITEAHGPLDDVHDGSCIIGHYVTVGHNCVLRATTIEPECLVGMGSTLAEGSYMEKQSILGAGSYLGPGQKVPSGELWAGNPARKIRDITEEERESFKTMAVRYHDLANAHKDEYETTPLPMDAVWEAEKLGLGNVIGYTTKQ